MARPTRRGFLVGLAAGSAALVTAGSVFSGDPPAAAGDDRDELGMLYDATRCVGCKACMAACKRVNGDYGALAFERAPFDPDGLWDAPQDLSGSTRTLIKLFKQSESEWSYVKYSCMHCRKPSCVSVCPVSAMTRDPKTGIVDYSKDTCIGCRYCQVACAFNIPRFQWDSAAPQIVKCDLCKHTHLEKTGVTACAGACPVGAITFGRRHDLLAEARRRLAEKPGSYLGHIYGEHEVGGTNHLYLAAMPFNKLGLPQLPAEPPAEFSEKIQHTIYKGFVAPVALYGALCWLALRNLKKQPHGDGSRAPGDREEDRHEP
ncbi:MAG: hydrogenase 2 operon protein HybA [Deltaproteobacteria bacterium]|nr:MAG: hydrogenase 2 operon protein HybA [Deltaproteobacteria bacterium]